MVRVYNNRSGVLLITVYVTGEEVLVDYGKDYFLSEEWVKTYVKQANGWRNGNAQYIALAVAPSESSLLKSKMMWL